MKGLLSSAEKKIAKTLEKARRSNDVDKVRDLAAELRSLLESVPEFKRQQIRIIRKFLKQNFKEHEDEIVAGLVSTFNASDIERVYVESAGKYNRIQECSSFRACLTLRTRRRLLAGKVSCREWHMDHKLRAYKFADAIGVRRPWQKGPFDFSEVEFTAGSVLKPAAGGAAAGVYTFMDDGSVFDVSRGAMLSSWDEARERIKNDMRTGRVKARKWVVEERISDSSGNKSLTKDIKFLCFYGKAMLVREFVRSPKRADNWWDSKGNPAEVGDGLQTSPLGGPAPPAEYYQLAERISREIPAPFMRIDFITSDDGLVLCEFTPRPGTYHRFNSYWDQVLGDAYLKAEAELEADLLAGKKFSVYHEFLKEFPL